MNENANKGSIEGAGVVNGLGTRLRALRKARGLSLTQVAAATGISSSFLSLVETGKNDLTVARLVRLVSYFGVAVTDLLPASVEQRPEIVRRGHERRIPSRSEKMDLYLLVNEGDRAMMPVLATYEVGGGTAEFISYESDQFDYVLEGAIELIFEGDEPILLEKGDAAYYAGRRAHKYRNAGDGPARAFHVRSPAT